MKSIFVIGAGELGMHIAKMFAELGNETFVMDISEERIDDISQYVSEAIIGDCTKRSVLEKQGIDNFDICIVSLADLGESLEATYLLKDLGAPFIISQANNELHAELLKRSGADETVYPAKQIAERIAMRHTAKKVLDYVEITSEYSVCEIKVPQSWVGKTVHKLGIRQRYQINILAYKRDGSFIEEVQPSHLFKEDEQLLVFGQKKIITKLSNRLY